MPPTAASGPTDYFARHLIDDPQIPIAVRPSDIPDVVREHRHDFVEIALVTHGRALHSWRHGDEQQHYEIHSGDVFAISPGQEHGYSRSKGLQLTNLIFDESMLHDRHDHLADLAGLRAFFLIEPLFRSESAFRHKLHLDPNARLALGNCFEGLKTCLEKRETGYATLAKARFLECMVLIAQAYENGKQGYGSNEQTAQRRAVDQAIAYMEEHFEERLSIADIAREVYLSPTYFAECFKRETGSPPGDFLIGVRLEAAARMLRESDTPITRLALDAGFCDNGYFARVFKQRYGQTPSAWRSGGGSSA